MSRIKYTCKNCGWMTSVVSQWADLKPKRCMNAKCNTSFVRDKESLLVDDPTRKKPKEVKPKASSKVVQEKVEKVEEVKPKPQSKSTKEKEKSKSEH